ncbi:MAG: hypothetical protein EA369_08225 [Bradymonadales bacterium]|nr:MAG: hypothetical protein EA369_08225 [Bradymonadales bacterium]
MFVSHWPELREAEKAFDARQFASAEGALSRILAKDDSVFEARLYRALARLYLGKLQEAKEDTSFCCKIRPNDSVAWMLQGEVELEVQEFEASYQSFSEAIRLEKDNGRALFGMAKAAVALGKTREASDLLEEALQFDRDFVLAQCFSRLLRMPS